MHQSLYTQCTYKFDQRTAIYLDAQPLQRYYDPIAEKQRPKPFASLYSHIVRSLNAPEERLHEVPPMVPPLSRPAWA